VVNEQDFSSKYRSLGVEVRAADEVVLGCFWCCLVTGTERVFSDMQLVMEM
jgi:hypothetical protein